jgi:hypothetical protein
MLSTVQSNFQDGRAFCAFRAALLALALIRCAPVLAQGTPPAQAAVTATQDTPPPKTGEVVRPWQPGDPEPKGPLQIVIIDGQNGVNIARKKKKSAVRPVVEIRDGKNTPISGASVHFSAPTDGPSVTFSNGLRSIEVLTDNTGRASLDDLKPLSLGQFDVSVAATFRSLSATSSITMTNALKAEPKDKPVTSGAARSSGMSGKTVGILVGVAAAAAIGIGVGMAGHGSTAATTTSTSTTATIGTGSGGTVGAPH